MQGQLHRCIAIANAGATSINVSSRCKATAHAIDSAVTAAFRICAFALCFSVRVAHAMLLTWWGLLPFRGQRLLEKPLVHPRQASWLVEVETLVLLPQPAMLMLPLSKHLSHRCSFDWNNLYCPAWQAESQVQLSLECS